MEGAAAQPSPFRPGNPDHPTPAYVFLRFLRYGLLAWGGPVAQISLMHDELVTRDGWIKEERFRKVFALYQALPGPEALELAVYFGMTKRGRIGGLLAGLGFMMPGVLLVTALAALYVAYAAITPILFDLLYGVRPAVLALVLVGIYRLGRRALTTIELLIVALGSALAWYYFPQFDFILILLLGGVLAMILAGIAPPILRGRGLAFLPLVATFPALSSAGLASLAWLSLKVGFLTFGGAYTAIPILYEGAVEEHGWITEQQFLDALAVASLAPAPLISIGTFVGYQAAGLGGAALATVLIFAPAFVFTLAGHNFFERIVGEPRIHEFLMGVTAAAIGLIAIAVLPLGQAAVLDGPTAIIAAVAAGALLSHKVPIPLILVGAALLGLGVLEAAPHLPP